jgi:hypothetical protein
MRQIRRIHALALTVAVGLIPVTWPSPAIAQQENKDAAKCLKLIDKAQRQAIIQSLKTGEAQDFDVDSILRNRKCCRSFSEDEKKCIDPALDPSVIGYDGCPGIPETDCGKNEVVALEGYLDCVTCSVDEVKRAGRGPDPCGNGVVDEGEECDPPGEIGQCAGCQLCIAGCKCNTPPPAGSCPANPDGGPNLLAVAVQKGSDLDVGWTGVGHNQGVIVGAQSFACLSGCDRENNPVCSGTMPFGEGAINGTTFGPPLPLLAEGVATCVVNKWAADVGSPPEASVVRSVNLQTGEIEFRATLKSDVYLTGNEVRPCPTCKGALTIGQSGKCAGGRNNGKACVTEGISELFGPTSSTCLPVGIELVATVSVEIDPITSGVADSTRLGKHGCTGGECPRPDQSKANGCTNPARCAASECPSTDVASGIQPGVDQACCPAGGDKIGCFPAVVDVADPLIVRRGKPTIGENPGIPGSQWPEGTYPKIATGGEVAGVFLIDATGSNTIDTTAGLPGPGAFVLVGDACVDDLQ